MSKIGILLHVYHLETSDWDKLVWGDPEQDRYGTLPRFTETLLGIPEGAEVVSVIYSGPSQRDGLIEGAYAKQFLLNHLGQLAQFPGLKKKLDSLQPAEYKVFLQRVNDLRTGEVIANTLDEVTHAAEYFKKQKVDEVIQIATASHAPRCLLNQLIVRDKGLIDRQQSWRIIASENCYPGTSLDDVVVLEPSHRGDDPLTSYRPTLGAVMKSYFKLSGDDKKQLIAEIEKFIATKLS